MSPLKLRVLSLPDDMQWERRVRGDGVSVDHCSKCDDDVINHERPIRPGVVMMQSCRCVREALNETFPTDDWNESDG